MRSKMKWGLCLAVIGAAALALPAAAESVERVVPAKADADVSIECISGTITVKVWDQLQVRVIGELGPDVEGLEVDADDGDVDIEVEYPENGANDVSVNLTVFVPRGCNLDLETVSAGMKIEGVTGSIDVENVSGNVEIDGARGEIDVENVSGDVVVSGTPTEVDIEAVSGTVVLSGDMGSVDVEAVNGTIKFDGTAKSLSVENINGTIVLTVPESMSATYNLSTFNGSIANDFGPKAQKETPFLPSASLKFTQGTGTSSISAESFNGTVQLKRKAVAPAVEPPATPPAAQPAI